MPTRIIPVTPESRARALSIWITRERPKLRLTKGMAKAFARMERGLEP